MTSNSEPAFVGWVEITITQHVDEQRENIFYRYQVGKTTPDNPVGIVIGATPDFLQAVQFSLEAAMSAAQGKPPHVARREYNL